MKDNGSNLFLLSSLERGGTGVDGLTVNSPSSSPFSLCPLSCLFLPFSFSSSCQPAALGWHFQQLGRHGLFRRGIRWHFSQFFSPFFPSPLPLAGITHGIGETTRFEELVRAGNKGGKRRLEPTVAVWRYLQKSYMHIFQECRCSKPHPWMSGCLLPLLFSAVWWFHPANETAGGDHVAEQSAGNIQLIR